MGNVAVVSNSREALQRIIETAAGKTPSLAGAKDFQYMRTIYPEEEGDEDLFIYLSDSHIRKLVGPRWKIGEARRMRCAANLQYIANAQFWYRSERRREPSFDELAADGYFGRGSPSCPDGGNYSLAKKNGRHPRCSIHNRTGYLTPLGEIAASDVTSDEADQYKAFGENYMRYWSQFFDPIGIRIKLGETIRIETCILPLIENSWYDGLIAFSGHETGSLTETSTIPRTIISLRGHLSPDWWKKTGLIREFAERRKLPLTWLGNEISLNLCDGQVLFTVEGRATGLLGMERGQPSLQPIIIGYVLSALNLPTYLSVKVTEPAEAERAVPWIFQTLFLERGSDGFSEPTEMRCCCCLRERSTAIPHTRGPSSRLPRREQCSS